LFPNPDLWASQLLYSGNHDLIGSHSTVLNLARTTFNAAFVLTYLMAAVGVIIASISRRGWLTLPFYKWLFLAVCLGVGPGIVVDLGLKDHRGRARPYDVVEFGGAKTFSSPIHLSDQYESHCSFVSGEASSIFTIFFGGSDVQNTRANTNSAWLDLWKRCWVCPHGLGRRISFRCRVCWSPDGVAGLPHPARLIR
jgi:lipid A 4'-phosphatase